MCNGSTHSCSPGNHLIAYSWQSKKQIAIAAHCHGVLHRTLCQTSIHINIDGIHGSPGLCAMLSQTLQMGNILPAVSQECAVRNEEESDSVEFSFIKLCSQALHQRVSRALEGAQQMGYLKSTSTFRVSGFQGPELIQCSKTHACSSHPKLACQLLLCNRHGSFNTKNGKDCKSNNVAGVFACSVFPGCSSFGVYQCVSIKSAAFSPVTTRHCSLLPFREIRGGLASAGKIESNSMASRSWHHGDSP